MIGLGLAINKGQVVSGFTGLLDLYTGAAAAYSLRALSSGWAAGDVVEVRPSSGWTPASFTAGQVTNGEMVDYVKRPGNFTNFGFEAFSNNGTGDGFTATNSASSGFSYSDTVSGVVADVVTINFDITIVSGSPSLSLRSGANGGSTASNLLAISTSGSYSSVLTATGSFNKFAFSEGDVPSEFTISNVRVSTNDGFVSTWYDQSGNANNATQATTTAQPKIVSAGALVAGGLDFDGVDDYLFNSLAISYNGGLSWFSVQKMSNVTDDLRIWGDDITGVQGNSVLYVNGKYQLNDNGSGYKQINATGLTINTEQLASFTFDDSSGSYSYGIDGANSIGTLVGWSGPIVPGGASNLGIMSAGNGGQYGDGTIQELIIYPDDQSANRVAIEANINAAYTIY